MARLRARQKEEIIRRTLSRISPAVAGAAPGPVSGVGSVNGRTGNVVLIAGDVPAHHTTHENGGTDQVSVAGLLGVLANPQPPIIGSTATTAVAGNDSRLTDARTPLAHAVTHKSGGSDPIKLDELAAPTDILTLNASAAAHGLLPKLPGGTTTFLRADGTFATPASSPPPNGSVAEAYDRGTITLATDQYVVQDKHLYMSGANRLSAAGTAEVLLTDLGNTASVIMGTPKCPSLSFTVLTDWFFDVIRRLSLSSQIRATLQGNADLILTDDFGSRSRIVLAGMG